MSNAAVLFTELLEGKYQKINQMIKEHQEEGLFIDFKEKANANIPGAQNDDKKIFAKALSGFSNADGGILVWGIEARSVNKDEPDVAGEMKPIKHLKKFLTDLNSLVSDAIVPLNTGIQNIAIFINDDPLKDEGFIVSFVPSSDKPPHRAMCKDNKYYTRAGDNFILMEHYMLEDAFGRRQKPKLEFFYKLRNSTNMTFDRDGDVYFKVLIGIKNTGKYIATYPSMMLKPKRGVRISYENLDIHSLNWKNQSEFGGSQLFTGGVDNVIHPGTTLEVCSLVPKKEWTISEKIRSFSFDNINIELEYELFAEGCSSVSGKVSISAEEVEDFLRLT
ncbi:helix-turn-helix domain-containing protein [Paenibacillus polymyxa]|uniref:AlbA family DNA-binding domain-containing protein n=1 Tax=Paenibacillus polymyxa TaxID=1406 RepID=UPI002221CE05|nr:ATP-binding protein [Paenibacillus polymyxa]